jgi:quercetin dioxygenase-like cupin family protein
MKIEIINLLNSIAETPIDPDVGIVLIQGVSEPGVSVGLAVVQQQIQPHYQKVSDEIYFILRGQGELTVDGETKQLWEGDAATIPKGKIHGC